MGQTFSCPKPSRASWTCRKIWESRDMLDNNQPWAHQHQSSIKKSYARILGLHSNVPWRAVFCNCHASPRSRFNFWLAANNRPLLLIDSLVRLMLLIPSIARARRLMNQQIIALGNVAMPRICFITPQAVLVLAFLEQTLSLNGINAALWVKFVRSQVLILSECYGLNVFT